MTVFAPAAAARCVSPVSLPMYSRASCASAAISPKLSAPTNAQSGTVSVGLHRRDQCLVAASADQHDRAGRSDSPAPRNSRRPALHVHDHARIAPARRVDDQICPLDCRARAVWRAASRDPLSETGILARQSRRVNAQRPRHVEVNLGLVTRHRSDRSSRGRCSRSRAPRCRVRRAAGCPTAARRGSSAASAPATPPESNCPARNWRTKRTIPPSDLTGSASISGVDHGVEQVVMFNRGFRPASHRPGDIRLRIGAPQRLQGRRCQHHVADAAGQNQNNPAWIARGGSRRENRERRVSKSLYHGAE